MAFALRESSVVLQEPVVSAGDAVSKRNRRAPAERAQFGNIEKFSWRAVRFGFVPTQFAAETDHVANQLRQFANRNVFAVTDVDDVGRIIFFEKVKTGRRAIVRVQ